MKFQFETFADFIAMNGHGPFVWAAYGITFAALIFLLFSPVLQKKAFIKQQQKLQKLAQVNPDGQGVD
ncbi:heme exporter protein CcmD [Cellvibrio sp. KY-GH-1]|uniref:heme exporter protein CcmD n=1 Tax=Cellvibrio sp. KY-GH-1 TaxID=2303332 RepID=UPI001244B4EE|nr:heme exporter protein CcmD [Cellvibrio sp. KY-GH-1]QEY15005.1 heme exporter protein CcmD [Cellvibrio sp. KY-GH-1]